MQSLLSVLHVGCGAMAGAWLKSASAHPALRVAGLVDLSLEAATKRGEEFAPEAYVGNNLDEALAAVKPDVVFNCTIPRAHHAVTCAALRSGAHVLTEKPLADSLEEARDIIRVAGETNRIVAVVQNRRYNSAARTVKRLVDEGAIGQLTTISCDFCVGAHFGGFRDEMEHVLLLDMSIHHFDMARFFSGSRLARVYCHEWNPAGSWYRHGASAQAIFNLFSGVVFNYRGSWCAEGLGTDWNGEWRLVGTEGSLRWNGESEIKFEKVTGTSGFLRECVAFSPEVQAVPGKDLGHESVIAEFVECVRSGKVPETNAEDNYHSLEMVFAAIESSKSGSTCSAPRQA